MYVKKPFDRFLEVIMIKKERHEIHIDMYMAFISREVRKG